MLDSVVTCFSDYPHHLVPSDLSFRIYKEFKNNVGPQPAGPRPWSSPAPEESQAVAPLSLFHTPSVVRGLGGLVLASPSLGSYLSGFYLPAPP